MKNAGMTGAVALVGIGLITIGLSNFQSTPQAVAAAPVAAAVEQGPEEPTIVWMDSMGVGGKATYSRLWSDGRIEVRQLYFEEPYQMIVCDLPLVSSSNVGGLCGFTGQVLNDTGWIELPPPPGGEGFACRSDINGDRRVDGVDLAYVLSGWGDGVSCDPQPSYPCFDLGNLNLPKGAM